MIYQDVINRTITFGWVYTLESDDFSNLIGPVETKLREKLSAWSDMLVPSFCTDDPCSNVDIFVSSPGEVTVLIVATGIK